MESRVEALENSLELLKQMTCEHGVQLRALESNLSEVKRNVGAMGGKKQGVDFGGEEDETLPSCDTTSSQSDKHFIFYGDEQIRHFMENDLVFYPM